MDKLLLVPDSHCPYQDKKAEKLLFEFAKDFKPTKVVHIGDVGDFENISRWNKGLPEETLISLEDHIHSTQRFLEELRAASGGVPLEIKIGNHDLRLETYLRKYAPGFRTLKSLTLEGIYGAHCTRIHRKIFHVAPSTVCAHGDEVGGSGGPGSTALKLVKKLGKSVVCGHIHRLALVHETVGYNGRGSTLFGMECGHLLDVSKASYLETGFSNWQMGWGMLIVEGRRVYPSLVRVDKGKVIFGEKVLGGGES